MPKWDDKDSLVDVGAGWRCAVAQDSHRSTLMEFQLEPKDHGENGMNQSTIGMNGEPFGRQMWTSQPRINTTNSTSTTTTNTATSPQEEDSDEDGWTKISSQNMSQIQLFAQGGRSNFQFNPRFYKGSATM